MRGLGKSLRAIFDKLADFFDIFDLSFFVSGSLSLGALLLWYRLARLHLLADVQDGYRVAALLLGCYALGLVSFTVGRVLRRMIFFLYRRKPWWRRFHAAFREALEFHGLIDQMGLASYFRDDRRNRAQGLYILFWAKLRQSRHLAPSLTFLNRYWVMTATYDGTAVSFLVWAGMMLCWWRGIGMAAPGGRGPIVAAALLVLAAIACFREAERYAMYQIEELCATIAWDRTAGPPPDEPADRSDKPAAVVRVETGDSDD